MFLYNKWDEFCRQLKESGFNSIPACEVLEHRYNKQFVVLKHDVETKPKNALKLARIEEKYAQRGSYYVQAYLLNKYNNIKILKKIQNMGHEVTYHHDVMDSCNGDLKQAEQEFELNREKFETNGFLVKTVCQHGNPIMNRVNYNSNRDFFRSKEIELKHPNICDIMVNLKKRTNTDYIYISDAGYGWKIIFDPETNDITNSDDKNISLKRLSESIDILNKGNSLIISTHPHRWCSSFVYYQMRHTMFITVKRAIKLMTKIPFVKKVLSKYYYLAKKI